jgi:hypothetical protein
MGGGESTSVDNLVYLSSSYFLANLSNRLLSNQQLTLFLLTCVSAGRSLGVSTTFHTLVGGQPDGPAAVFGYVWRVWPAQVTARAKEYVACHQDKTCRHAQLQPKHIPFTPTHFTHIHIDLIGPLQSSNGCSHLFTVVDCCSHRLEAFAGRHMHPHSSWLDFGHWPPTGAPVHFFYFFSSDGSLPAVRHVSCSDNSLLSPVQ